MSNITPGMSMDAEVLHLPLSGLFADLDAGQGSISFSNDFLGEPSTVQLAVIDDWCRALVNQRHRALIQLYHDVCEPLGDMPAPAKLDHFRDHCATMGVECPADFAVLLQRY